MEGYIVARGSYHFSCVGKNDHVAGLAGRGATICPKGGERSEPVAPDGGRAAVRLHVSAWGVADGRTDISRMGDRLDKRIDGLEKRLVDGLDGLLRAVEHGLAKLEGLLEGLREAIAGRKDVA